MDDAGSELEPGPEGRAPPAGADDEITMIKRHLRSLRNKHAESKAIHGDTYVRECKDAGTALVPCNPLDNTCPPESHLRDTPYQHMYSTVGKSPHNIAVRCVPPEMIQIPLHNATKKAQTIEEQEESLIDRVGVHVVYRVALGKGEGP